MVSVDFMLISILSVSIEVLEILCAEAADALTPLACDNLLSPLHLMCHFSSQINPIFSSAFPSSLFGHVQTWIV